MEAGASVDPGGSAARVASRADALDLLAWGGLLLAVAWFLLIKSYCFRWQVSDENIYYYMAWAAADHGALPYRDFFFAHPPLHLLPGIAVFAPFGFGPFTARCLPIGATVTAAVFLFLIARRHIGRLAAACTAALYLNCFEVLGDSTHWTGINLAVMWMVIGLWALLRGRTAAAGVLFALAVSTGNYALPAAVMGGLLACLHGRRAGGRYVIGFIVPWLVIQLAGLLLGGRGYVDSVYRYHFIKPAGGGVALGLFFQVLTTNLLLFVGAALGVVLAELDRFLSRVTGCGEPSEEPASRGIGPGLKGLWRKWREELLGDGARGLARIGGLWALGYVLFIFTLPAVFQFYFLPMFPGLALAAGFAADRVMCHGWRLAVSGGCDRLRRHPQWGKAARMLGTAVLISFGVYALRVPLQRLLVPAYVRSVDVPMQWSDSPLPINAFMRWCCWNDVARAGASYGTLHETLYHESRYFEQAQTLADYVRRHTGPGQVLFGDSSTAGLVALLAGRRLAADCADTNVMRFSSGETAADEVIRRIDTPELALVLMQARRAANGAGTLDYAGFAALPAFRRWLDERFEIVFQVDDRTKGTFVLLGRKP